MTSTKLAPIFRKPSDILAQGSWKIFPNELLVFTDSNIEHRSKIAGFDLDGTLIKTKSGNVFPKDINDWEIWHSTVLKELVNLNDTGFKVCIFTNQKGIQMGKVSLSAFKGKIQKICSRIGITMQVFISLGSLNFRKPYIGMWNLLETSFNGNVKVDRLNSIYVGDAAGRVRTKERLRSDHSLSDRLFAINLNVNFFTPEQFFLKKKKIEEFSMPVFDPSIILNKSLDLFQPVDTKFPIAQSELLVMVGPPASGKSTISLQLSNQHGYVIVNQDILKTWQKCFEHASELLDLKKRVIIDNTNRDLETRQRYIKLAKDKNIPCRCIVMKVSMSHSFHNNRYRQIAKLVDKNHLNVNDTVIRMFYTSFKKPNSIEGFNDIIKVNFVPNFKNDEYRKIYSLYLVDFID